MCWQYNFHRKTNKYFILFNNFEIDILVTMRIIIDKDSIKSKPKKAFDSFCLFLQYYCQFFNY